ncbi:MAG TPA: GNAT family protein [Phycisphaerales bacterium]
MNTMTNASSNTPSGTPSNASVISSGEPAPIRVRPTTLEGGVVRLEPLDERHASDLLEETARDTFRYFRGPPPVWTLDGWKRFIREAIATPARVPFAVVERSSGRCVGSSSYCDIREADRGVEIGYTWYAERCRGTMVNPESKLLLLAHAFETLGCVRVQLKCDARNTRSAAAIAKLGAKHEGIIRSHLYMHDGHLRDTSQFSIIAAEWPAVKAGLEARLRASSR